MSVRFYFLTEFYDHMTAKHEMELRYMCQLHNCQQTFSDSKIYKKHAAVHQPRSFMYCITCEVAFPSSSELSKNFLHYKLFIPPESS